MDDEVQEVRAFSLLRWETRRKPWSRRRERERERRWREQTV